MTLQTTPHPFRETTDAHDQAVRELRAAAHP